MKPEHEEINMASTLLKTARIAATAMLINAGALPPRAAIAQTQTGTKRTDLQRHDLETPGLEAIQVRVDFAPGAAFARHKHPGEEIIYVLEGALEHQVDGKPPVTLKAADVLFVPAGTVHAARNVGNSNAAELATYVVEKAKPLVTFAK
jgi:quercetin dioxygenase-like cupin family protein